MAVSEAHAVPERLPRHRQVARTHARRRTRVRTRGGIGWIVLCGVLLAGVVFVNVAVLRLNLSLDASNSDRAKLRAETAALQSELSAALASPRIETRARVEDGLVQADPSTIGYVDLGR